MVLPGFGNPIDKNTALLTRNLELIRATSGDMEIDVKIYCFVDEKVDISRINCAGLKVEVFYERGVIGEFLYRHITPEVVAPYDYLLISMDDMELMPDFNFSEFIKENRVDWEILSPCLTNDSEYTHEHMLKKENTGLKFHGGLELFFYIMTKEGYLHYFDVFINDPKVNWLWCVDAIFGKKGFKSYINFDYQMKHWHKGASRCQDAVIECFYNMDKHLVPKCIIHISEIEEPSWREMNPEFNYVLVNKDTERKIISLYFTRFLERYDEDLDGRRELVKNAVLYLEGGVYIYGDVKCLNPLDESIKYMETTSRLDGKTDFGFDILILEYMIISKKRRPYWRNLMDGDAGGSEDRIKILDK
jgi:hypothetical protein